LRFFLVSFSVSIFFYNYFSFCSILRISVLPPVGSGTGSSGLLRLPEL
jgi:hypothetical protein